MSTEASVVKIAVYPTTSAASGSSADNIHLVRPVKLALLEKMLAGKSNGSISMSPSTMKRLPKKARALLEKRNLRVEIEKHQGRSLSDGEKLKDVVEMRRDFRSYREIEKSLGIPKSTVHYLIKYAKRSKLKKGKDVFYLD